MIRRATRDDAKFSIEWSNSRLVANSLHLRSIFSSFYQPYTRGKKYKPQYAVNQHYAYAVIAAAACVYKGYRAVYKAYQPQHGKQRPENPFQIHSSNICKPGKRSVPKKECGERERSAGSVIRLLFVFWVLA